MAPQFVKPYVKTNKNDARDAEAICEAVGRANMRFVAIKTPEQQALLALPRKANRGPAASFALLNGHPTPAGSVDIVMLIVASTRREV